MIDRWMRHQVMLPRFRFARYRHSSEEENEEVDDEQDVDLAYTLDCRYVVSLQCFVQSSSSESSVLTIAAVIIIFTITVELLLPRVPYYSRNRRGT